MEFVCLYNYYNNYHIYYNCHVTVETNFKAITYCINLIIGFCILLRVILTVNNIFRFATIDKVFYYVASVRTTCFGPYETCREYRRYIIKYFVNCCETESIIYS
jgi:hypothetical protein